MTDLYPKEEYEVDANNSRADGGHIPEAVGVYDRPEESQVPPALIAVIALLLLVVAAGVVMLLIL